MGRVALGAEQGVEGGIAAGIQCTAVPPGWWWSMKILLGSIQTGAPGRFCIQIQSTACCGGPWGSYTRTWGTQLGCAHGQVDHRGEITQGPTIHHLPGHRPWVPGCCSRRALYPHTARLRRLDKLVGQEAQHLLTLGSYLLNRCRESVDSLLPSP